MFSLSNKIDWLSQQAELKPNSAFLISGNNTISFGQLNDRVKIAASFLKSNRIGEGSKVAVLSENNHNFIIITLALWKLNAIPVPVNVRLTSLEIEKQLLHAGCKHICIHSDLKESYKLSRNFPPIFFPFDNAVEVIDPVNNFDLNRTALLLYTSGSTGEPKGVELTFKNLFESAKAADTIINHSDDDIWMASLPFYHIGGFSIITRALLTGVALVIPDSLKTEVVHKAIMKFKPTLISLVPTMLKRLMVAGTKGNKFFRHAFVGGGPAESALLNNAIQLGWNLVKVYGSTETASMVTALSTKDFESKPEAAGLPIGKSIISIYDESGNLLGANQTGEIGIKGPSVMKGYLKENAPVNDEHFLSGDLGYIDEEGYLFVTGRKKDIIISGGENVNIREIENVILKFRGVVETAVFGIEDKEWIEAIAAAVVFKNIEGTEIIELQNFMHENLPSFKIPKRIFVIDEIPKTEMGKTDINSLKKLLRN